MEEEGNYDDSKEDESRLWCYCEQPSEQMVICDKNFPMSWFHFECLKLEHLQKEVVLSKSQKTEMEYCSIRCTLVPLYLITGSVVSLMCYFHLCWQKKGLEQFTSAFCFNI